MGTIKGQHLRLVINDKCVAAAQTCTVHLSVEMQATSSKDDTGSWQKQEPVGLSWDASTDALVIDGIYQAGSGATSQSVQVGGPNPAYIYPTGVSLSPGEGLEVSGAPASTDNLVLRKINATNYSVISTGGKYVNETTAAETVYVACMTNAQTLTWAVYDGNGLQLTDVFALKGQAVTVQFGTTNGTMNREADTQLLEGTAIVSDISVTAQNRALGTWTVQLSGSGELAFQDE